MPESLESNILDSVSSEDLISLGETGVELITSTQLEDEVLTQIPIFGTLAKLYKVGIGIREHLFIRKVHGFLFQLKDISDSKRMKFINELSNDARKEKEFGETIIMILESLDNLTKSKIIGNVIKALIEKNINYDLAMRLCSMLNRTYYPDLVFLYKTDNFESNRNISEQLRYVGFLDVIVEDFEVGQPEAAHNKYILNDYGRALKKFGFAGIIDEN